MEELQKCCLEKEKHFPLPGDYGMTSLKIDALQDEVYPPYPASYTASALITQDELQHSPTVPDTAKREKKKGINCSPKRATHKLQRK